MEIDRTSADVNLQLRSWLEGVVRTGSATVTLDRLDVVGAVEGDVLTYDGAEAAWSDVVAAGGCDLSVVSERVSELTCGTTTVRVRTPGEYIAVTGNADSVRLRASGAVTIVGGSGVPAPSGTYVGLSRGATNYYCAIEGTGALTCQGSRYSYAYSAPPAGSYVDVACSIGGGVDGYCCGVLTGGTVTCWDVRNPGTRQRRPAAGLSRWRRPPKAPAPGLEAGSSPCSVWSVRSPIRALARRANRSAGVLSSEFSSLWTTQVEPFVEIRTSPFLRLSKPRAVPHRVDDASRRGRALPCPCRLGMSSGSRVTRSSHRPPIKCWRRSARPSTTRTRPGYPLHPRVMDTPCRVGFGAHAAHGLHLCPVRVGSSDAAEGDRESRTSADANAPIRPWMEGVARTAG
jgi:hypothetical protein